MLKLLSISLLLLGSVSRSAQADGIDENRLIVLWASQKSVCSEGDEKSPDTWIACGRSDAFAAVLAAKGMCLDAGQNIWRVGSHARAGGDDHWRCSLVSS